MNKSLRNQLVSVATGRIDDSAQLLRNGLNVLLRAATYAQRLGRSQWDFAVEISELRKVGLTTCDLRWLVCAGYANHAREVTRPGDHQRAFSPSGDLTLSKQACFVITKKGIDIARRNGEARELVPWEESEFLADVSKEPQVADVPHWDGDRRELRYLDSLVKRFKLPSANQERILVTFEEEGWPPRIDDPLPAHPDQNPKRRLHDTIRSLNRNQKDCVIRFTGDGTGEGVLWEPASVTPNNA